MLVSHQNFARAALLCAVTSAATRSIPHVPDSTPTVYCTIAPRGVRCRWEGVLRTLPVGGMGVAVGTSEGLGFILAGLVRLADFDVGGRARLTLRDGPRGQNHVFRP
eukprot:4546744-Prymnesium_polylepis.1